MNHQESLERYLDRRLDAAETLRFEEHLTGCQSCHEYVQRWRKHEGQLVAHGRARVPAENAEARAQQLVVRARAARGEVRRPWWLWLPFGLVATLALVAVLRLVAAPSNDTSGALHFQALVEGQAEAPAVLLANQQFSADVAPLRLRVEQDRIGLAAGARIKVAHATKKELRLTLEKGQVACEIEPRAQRARVVVEAKGYQVVVVGTRFSVSVTPEGVGVAVDHGRVMVEGPDGRREAVNAGSLTRFGARAETTIERRDLGELEALQLRQLLEPLRALTEAPAEAPTGAGQAAPQTATPDEAEPTVVPTPSTRAHSKRGESVKLSRWRDLILAGDLVAAETGLQQHTRAHPDDVDGWLLLADVRRKVGHFDAAVRSYRKVIGLGDPSASNQARFLAGVILQDQLRAPAAAARMFEAYLAQGAALRPLEAAALLRMGKAHLALGHPEQARPMLQRVVVEHSNTALAAEAASLLTQLGAPPK